MPSALRLTIVTLALLATYSARAADFTAFPADAGVLNVRDFGAKGDGKTDDTDAIKKALAASGGDTGPAFWHDKIVYFPAGTYLVSAPIEKRYADGKFASGSILIGQSRESTIIRLKDAAPGYNDPAHPKAVIFTSARLLDKAGPTGGGKDYEGKGEGNDAFMNFIENMTVDVGAGNRGAIGIDYLANNLGAIRNVLVRAGQGSGATGIALTRKWPGPALLQDVTVTGFSTGIDVANTEYGVTMESIRLEKQDIGLRNDHNVLSIHDLTISAATLPISNLSADGLIVIDGGIIKGNSPDDAISNAGFLTLRNVKVDGYKSALGMARLAPLTGAYRESKLIGPGQMPWSLRAKNPPPVAGAVPEQWAGVAAPVGDNIDSTEAIRKAFASGAGTVYFPHATYLISENIVVPESVQRIVGMTSTIHAHPTNKLMRNQGMFRAHNSNPLVIEKIAFDNSYLGDDQIGVEAAGTGPVVLRDIIGAGVVTLRRPANGGEAFLENTCCGTISIEGNKGVWARQLNTEGMGTRISNNGAPLWILGIKTERNCTVLENTNGARTEILGGLLYITGTDADPAIPAFRNIDANLFLSYAEESFHPKSTYSVHLVDIKEGKSKTTNADALPKRTIGRMAPALVSQ